MPIDVCLVQSRALWWDGLMVWDRTVIIGHLIGLLRALSVLTSFSFYPLEQKDSWIHPKTEMTFFEISPCNVFSANICLIVLTVKGSMSSEVSCALSGWDINVCLIDQLLRCNVGHCHIWQKGGMPISVINTCVSIISPHLHQFPLCISFVPDANVGQCQLHLCWKCQAGL